MAAKISAVRALEILDSRGNPTVRVHVGLDTGLTASASVPSGASTGENEALELRDGDKKRYGGKGVLKAVANVNQTIAPKLLGMDPARQAEIDRLMIDLDGTPTKSKLGANAILGVSMAVARAAAMAADLPLYAYLGGTGAVRLPVPMMNILNGGKHADNSVDFQEFMVMPVGAPGTSPRPCATGPRRSTPSRRSCTSKYATSVGDEGGFAPNLKSNEEACEVIIEAIKAAGYTPGKDVALALDPAASSFYEQDGYNLAKSGQGRKTSAQMTELYQAWVDSYPIISIEDGLAENDWDGFRAHTEALGDKIQIVGDDLFVTNTQFVARGIREKSTNAVLIKLNQIGTVTETIEAIHMCQKAGWGYVVLAPLGRDRGRLPGRLRRGHGRRPDQDRLRLPQRAHRQVQPPPGNRGRTRPRRRLRAVEQRMTMISKLIAGWARLGKCRAVAVLVCIAVLGPVASLAADKKDDLILTPPSPAEPRIHGPSLFGVRPGSPVLYTIPATGQRPMVFSAQGLPPGVAVSADSGRITGRIQARGEYAVLLRARNARGSAVKKFRISVGDRICLTPPLGWNSWNCWAEAVDQDKVLRSARAMVRSGLVDHGWTYINIDDTWQGLRGGKFNAIQGNQKFPDMKGLCDAVHAMGLKAGIYSTPWITSYAKFCGGSSDDPSGAWSQALASDKFWRHGKHPFAENDARQWADWGFDYLKYDWNPNDLEHVEQMSQALRACRRDIVYSLSNSAPFPKAADWARLANCWRTTGDIWD